MFVRKAGVIVWYYCAISNSELMSPESPKTIESNISATVTDYHERRTGYGVVMTWGYGRD